MKKKFLMLLLGAVLTGVTLSGCGSAPAGETEESAVKEETPEEAAEKPEGSGESEEEAAEPEEAEEPEEEEPAIITVYLSVKETITQDDTDPWLSGEYEYDDHGNRTKWTSYWSDGTLADITETEYEYDDKDRIIKEVEYVLHEGAGEKHKDHEREYEYRTDGTAKTICVYYYEEDDLLDMVTNTIELEYDDHGNAIKSVSKVKYKDGSEEISEDTTEYEYDADGRVIKEVVCWTDGTKSIDENEYDDYGNLTKEESRIIYSDGTEEIMGTTIYENTYDDDGNRIKKVVRGSYGGEIDEEDAHEYLYEYDENGNVIKETHNFPNDGGKDVTEYEYIEMQVPNVKTLH